MKKCLLSATVLAILCTACKKDTPEPTERMFISMIDETATESISVSDYNKLKMPVRFSILDKDQTYDVAPVYENGRLTQVFGGKARYDTYLTHVYKYNDAGKPYRVDLYTSGIIDRYDSLAYDNEGHLGTIYHKKLSYSVDYPFGIYKKDVLVWDTAGNITHMHTIQIKNGQEAKDTTTTSYTYDNKINFLGKPAALFMINYDKGITYLCANNMLTQLTTYPTGDSATSVTNVYTYDNEHYPVTAKVNKKTTQSGVTLSDRTTDFKISYVRIPLNN